MKKAAKLAEMPKVISTADVEFVAKTLHPDDVEKDEAEEERKLIEDPDIKLNLYFHRGTSNTRATRYAFIKRRGSGGEPEVDDAELDVLLEGLNVPLTASSGKEKDLISAIRTAVREDMINVEKEHQQTMVRKGGFWRWASKKAYNRLIDNGRVWDEKEDESGTPRRKDSAAATDAGRAAEEVDESGAQAEGSFATEELAEALPATAPTQKAPVSTRLKSASLDMAASLENDGWTTVGTAKAKAKKAEVVGPLKLVSNGGLKKFDVKPKDAATAFSLFARAE